MGLRSGLCDGHSNTLTLLSLSNFKQFYFCFIRPENISPKYNLCTHVQLQTFVGLFYGGFGAVASSLLSGLSDYVNIGLVLL